jgi:hypothetical protein
MSTFEEPTVIATFDRSFGERREQLRLERSEFNGWPVFMLRVLWQSEDGTWRWSQAKPSQSGKCWQAFSLKARELRELGEALIAASEGVLGERGGQQRPPRGLTEPRSGARENRDDIPF